MLKNFIYISPQGHVYTIEAKDFNDLLVKMGDNPLHDRHGQFYEPEMKSIFMTSYKEISMQSRIQIEQERKIKDGEV